MYLTHTCLPPKTNSGGKNDILVALVNIYFISYASFFVVIEALFWAYSIFDGKLLIIVYIRWRSSFVADSPLDVYYEGYFLYV